MYAMAETERCPYEDFCREYHPEPKEEEYRKGCTGENCQNCGRFWAFHDGYSSLDEI